MYSLKTKNIFIFNSVQLENDFILNVLDSKCFKKSTLVWYCVLIRCPMENLDPEAKPDKTHCRLLIVLETNVLNMGKILLAALAVL